MKSVMTCVLVAMLLVPCCGCVQDAVLIKLNPNGSGMLIVRTLFAIRGDNPLAAFALSKSNEQQPADSKPGKWTEVQLKKTRDKMAGLAEQLGDGVKLESQRTVTRAGWTGLETTFSFPDINRLRSSGASKATEASDSPGTTVKAKKSPDYVFKYVPGEVNELTITVVPRDQKAETRTESSDAFEDAGLELTKSPNPADALGMTLVRTMFQDARISMLVQINGEIVETNAKYRPKPNSFFLLDLDLGKLVASEEFERAAAEKWGPTRMAKEKLPGLRAELPGETIQVRFRANEVE